MRSDYIFESSTGLYEVQNNSIKAFLILFLCGFFILQLTHTFFLNWRPCRLNSIRRLPPSNPRRENCRKPIMALMMPKTGSTVLFRLAYIFLPSGVFNRCYIRVSTSASSGKDPGWAKRSYKVFSI